MDINSVNSVSSQNNEAAKIKELMEIYNFNYFDEDGDGKLTGEEIEKLQRVYGSVSFDVDDDDSSINYESFKDALSEYTVPEADGKKGA